MSDFVNMPLFPLSLLPLPGELVPLHIFEPRYRELFSDLERFDVHFGIYCNHELNEQRIGSVMKLESVIKKYPGGESDVIVRCTDLFNLNKMYRNFRNKMYPGGEISRWYVNADEVVGEDLYSVFNEFQRRRNITKQFRLFSMYQIAIELNLDLFDRYKFALAEPSRKITFLHGHLKFQLHVLDQEAKSKDQFFLN
jgi:uncharacterized protein